MDQVNTAVKSSFSEKATKFFVAFSENLNFNKVIKKLCTDGKAEKGVH